MSANGDAVAGPSNVSSSPAAAHPSPRGESADDGPSLDNQIEASLQVMEGLEVAREGSRSQSATPQRAPSAIIKREHREVIDLDGIDGPPAKRIKTEASMNDDAELEKLEEEEKKLAEEIDREERLMKMKRKREALQVKLRGPEERGAKVFDLQ